MHVMRGMMLYEYNSMTYTYILSIRPIHLSIKWEYVTQDLNGTSVGKL